MNWLDIVILIVVVSGTFLGLGIGIIKAALSLGGLLVGIFLAGRYHVALSEQLAFIPQAGIAKALAFSIILVGIMVIASVLAMLLKRLTSLVKLGWLNHLGGGAFGLVLATLFSSAALAVWANFFSPTEIISQSRIAMILLDRFPAVLALLPDEFDAIGSFFR